MERAIVTVKHPTDNVTYDLEVPVTIAAQRLAELIVEGLHWDARVAYQIWVEPPGRRLNPQETLAQARIWDGAQLTLHPQTLVAPPPLAPRAQAPSVSTLSERLPQDGPVIGWRDILDRATVVEPVGADREEETPQHDTGYVWKQLD